MLTMHENPDHLLEALKAGAAGYVLEDALQYELVTAIHQVRKGESPLEPELSARLLKRLVAEGDGRRGAQLTPRGGVRAESLIPASWRCSGL